MIDWIKDLLNPPLTLDERRMEKSARYKKEKYNEYRRKRYHQRKQQKILQQLHENAAN